MPSDTEQLILSISADTRQIQRALSRLDSDAKTTGKSIEKSLSFSNDNASRSMRAMQADAKNLTFQLNDIAVSLAGGQSPFQVMMQQGSQVTQVLSGAGGIKNALTALGGAFAGLISPVGLATSAIIFGLGYALQYFTASKEGGKEAAKAQKELAEELKRQAALVREVAGEWKEVPAAIDAAVNAQEQFEKLGKRREAITITRRDLLAPLTDALQAAEPQVQKFFGLFDNTKFAPAIKDMATQWQLMMAQIESGGTTVKEVRAFLDSMIAGLEALPIAGAKALAEELKNVRSKLIEVTPKVNELDTAMNTLGQDATKVLTEMLHGFEALLGPLGPLLAAIEQMGGLMKGFDLGALINQGIVGLPGLFEKATTATPSAAKEFLKTRAEGDKITERIDALDDAFATALAKLLLILPAGTKIISAARTFQEQADIYARHQLMPGGIRAHPAAPPGLSHHERRERGGKLLEPQAVDLSGVDPDVLKAAIASIKELELLKGKTYERDKLHVQLAGGNAAADRDAAQATIEAADAQVKLNEAAAKGQEAYAKELASQQAAIDSQIKHNEMMVDSSKTLDQRKLAVDADTIAQQLNQAATANGITLTAQVIAQHQALAMSMAMAKQAATDIAAAQAAAAKATQDQKDALKQLNQQVQQMVSGAITGFISDLRNGVDAGEAFNNMLNRILDSLINIGVQMLTKSLFGGLFGGGGGLGAGLFHGGGIVGATNVPKRQVSPLLFANAPRLATGLMPSEFPAILHRGEMVIPKNMVGRGGTVVNNYSPVLGDIQMDMSQTGLVAADSASAKQFGINVQKLVQLEMVAQSRPGGLLRRVPS